MVEPTDFEVDSVIWSNLILAATAFVVLHVAAFVFLGGGLSRAYILIGRKELRKEWDRIAESYDKPAEKKALRDRLDGILGAVSTSFAWRYASLHSAIMLYLYLIGIATGLFGLVPGANPLLLRISFYTLFSSLIFSIGFMSTVFLLIFHSYRFRKARTPP